MTVRWEKLLLADKARRAPMRIAGLMWLMVIFVSGSATAEDTAAETAKKSDQEKPAAEPPEPLWSGALDFSATVRHGNTDSSALAVRMKAEQKTSGTRLVIEGAYDYGEESDVPNVKKGMLKSRLEWNTPGKAFPWAEIKGEHDRFANLDLRLTAAAGAGMRVLKEEKQTLSLRLGVAYINERAIPPATHRESVGTTAGLEWAAKPRPDTSVEVKIEWQHEGGPWRIKGEAALRQNLSRWLSLRFSLTDTYDSAPPTGTEANDLTVLVGIGVTF